MDSIYFLISFFLCWARLSTFFINNLNQFSQGQFSQTSYDFKNSILFNLARKQQVVKPQATSDGATKRRSYKQWVMEHQVASDEVTSSKQQAVNMKQQASDEITSDKTTRTKKTK